MSNILDFFEDKVYLSENGLLNVRMHFPNAQVGEKFPVLIWLHGACEQGDDNKSQILGFEYIFKKFFELSIFNNFIIVAPQCPKDKKWVMSRLSKPPETYNIDEISETDEIRKIVELVQKLKTCDYVDKDNIGVMGFSLGAFAGWDMMVRHPKLFNYAILSSGGCDYRKADRIKNIKILAFHSKEDFCINPKGVILMNQELEKIGGNMTLRLLEGNDHFICEKAFFSDEVCDLLKNKVSPLEYSIEQKL